MEPPTPVVVTSIGDRVGENHPEDTKPRRGAASGAKRAQAGHTGRDSRAQSLFPKESISFRVRVLQALLLPCALVLGALGTRGARRLPHALGPGADPEPPRPGAPSSRPGPAPQVAGSRGRDAAAGTRFLPGARGRVSDPGGPVDAEARGELQPRGRWGRRAPAGHGARASARPGAAPEVGPARAHRASPCAAECGAGPCRPTRSRCGPHCCPWWGRERSWGAGRTTGLRSTCRAAGAARGQVPGSGGAGLGAGPGAPRASRGRGRPQSLVYLG